MLLVLFSVFALVSAIDPLLSELCMRTPHIRSLADNWCSETVAPCQWEGITCFNGRVISVRISNLPIEITLPIEALSTSSIEQLELRGCGIRGPLESIVQSGHLNLIDLSNNPVTGFVSSELLHSNIALRLSRVQINGTISQILCNQNPSGLQELDLSENAIVDDLSGCSGLLLPQLRSLKLQGNSFSGRAPFPPGMIVYNITGNDFSSLETNVSPSFYEITDLQGKDKKKKISVPNLTKCDMSQNLFTDNAPLWLKNSTGVNLNKLAKCKYENKREILK